MKQKKKVIVFVMLIVLFCFVSKGFGLVKTADRHNGRLAISKENIERINKECMGLDPKGCVKYAMELTCELLSFSEKNDVANGKANCVGYAILCSNICNYALKVNNLSNRAKPVVGYVTFYGINMCNVLSTLAPHTYKNFVKDHDFVELDLGDRYLFFDASLYDYYLDCTTSLNKSN